MIRDDLLEDELKEDVRRDQAHQAMLAEGYCLCECGRYIYEQDSHTLTDGAGHDDCVCQDCYDTKVPHCSDNHFNVKHVAGSLYYCLVESCTETPFHYSVRQ